LPNKPKELDYVELRDKLDKDRFVLVRLQKTPDPKEGQIVLEIKNRSQKVSESLKTIKDKEKEEDKDNRELDEIFEYVKENLSRAATVLVLMKADAKRSGPSSRGQETYVGSVVHQPSESITGEGSKPKQTKEENIAAVLIEDAKRKAAIYRNKLDAYVKTIPTLRADEVVQVVGYFKNTILALSEIKKQLIKYKDEKGAQGAIDVIDELIKDCNKGIGGTERKGEHVVSKTMRKALDCTEKLISSVENDYMGLNRANLESRIRDFRQIIVVFSKFRSLSQMGEENRKRSVNLGSRVGVLLKRMQRRFAKLG